MAIAREILHAGDVLLYRPRGLFGWLISVKTWSRYAHVEVYDGHDYALASRDGVGVGRYPYRSEDLAAVYRPRVPFDMNAGRRWFATVNGQPYDWFGLLAFTSAKLQGRENGAMFCSEFAVRFLRRCIGAKCAHPAAQQGNARVLAVLGLDPWNGYDADGLAPGEMAKSPLLRLEAES